MEDYKMPDGLPKIYAVDFDGTLCVDKYPDIGEPNLSLIDFLLSEQRRGAKLILWTNRQNEYLEAAIDFCKIYDLIFDTINANIPEAIDRYGTDCRKVFAHVYIDDKSISKNLFHLPYREDNDIELTGDITSDNYKISMELKSNKILDVKERFYQTAKAIISINSKDNETANVSANITENGDYIDSDDAVFNANGELILNTKNGG